MHFTVHELSVHLEVTQSSLQPFEKNCLTNASTIQTGSMCLTNAQTFWNPKIRIVSNQISRAQQYFIKTFLNRANNAITCPYCGVAATI